MSISRADFPVLERTSYLNAGSVGPLSAQTAAAMAEWEEKGLREGRGSHSAFGLRRELREQLRGRLAALLKAPAENVALTGSTTDGCHLVLYGLELQPGDDVVTTDAEHFGLLGTLRSCGATTRTAAVLGRSPADALRAILEAVTPRTRLVALSHVLWLNGQVLPIGEIRRESGLPLLVDGAQSVGAIEVAATDADYYTVSGQKWLCGPELTGALYVADPDRLRPRLVADPAAFAIPAMPGAARLELAFHPAALTAGLLAAVDDLPANAFERAAQMTARCRQLLLAAGVQVLTEADQGTLVAFTLPGVPPEEVVDRCEERGVVIRSLPNGWLRASCGWWTSEDDLQRLVASLPLD